MPGNEFQIEFTYDHIPFIGIVSPMEKGSETWYTVKLESENQESFLGIIAKPTRFLWEDWDFECENGENALSYYNKGLLEEIGEAIEKYLIAGSA
jgi:hypothetical protein